MYRAPGGTGNPSRWSCQSSGRGPRPARLGADGDPSSTSRTRKQTARRLSSSVRFSDAQTGSCWRRGRASGVGQGIRLRLLNRTEPDLRGDRVRLFQRGRSKIEDLLAKTAKLTLHVRIPPCQVIEKVVDPVDQCAAGYHADRQAERRTAATGTFCRLGRPPCRARVRAPPSARPATRTATPRVVNLEIVMAWSTPLASRVAVLVAMAVTAVCLFANASDDLTALSIHSTGTVCSARTMRGLLDRP